jgi:hypothetical protein
MGEEEIIVSDLSLDSDGMQHAREQKEAAAEKEQVRPCLAHAMLASETSETKMAQLRDRIEDGIENKRPPSALSRPYNQMVINNIQSVNSLELSDDSESEDGITGMQLHARNDAELYRTQPSLYSDHDHVEQARLEVRVCCSCTHLAVVYETRLA